MRNYLLKNFFIILACFLVAPFSAQAVFAPSDLAGLKVWVESDSGLWADAGKTTPATTNVKVWADQSGNGNDFVNSCDFIWNCPGYISSADALSSTYYRKTGYGNNFLRLGIGGYSFFTGNILDSSYDTNLTIFAVSGIADGGDGDFNMPDVASPTNSYGWYQAKNQLFSTRTLTATDLTVPASASRLSLNVYRYDGANRTTWHNLNKSSDALTGNLNLTGRIQIIGSYKVAFLVYNQALSDADVLQVQTYLRNKYMRPTAPQIMFDGDSLTYSYGATGGEDSPGASKLFPEDVYFNLPDHNIANFGLIGQNTAQMDAGAPAKIDIYYDAARAHNFLVGWGGTNDLVNYGLSATQTYDGQAAYFQNRKSAGWSNIVLTIIDRNSGEGTFEGKRQTVNTNLKNNFGSFADALVDIGSDPYIGAAGQNANMTYFGDGIHLTNAGYQIVADYTTTAIQALETPLTSLTGATVSSIGNTSANLTWTTNASSTSLIEVGSGSTVIATSTEGDVATGVKSHSKTITGLQPCTAYKVRALSYRLSPSGIVKLKNNTATSSIINIETTGCTGGASITSSSTATILSASGGSLSLLDGSSKGISLTVPVGFSASTSVDFQAKKLDSTAFAASAGTPTGQTMVGTQVFNLNALPTATSTISTFDQPLTITLTYDTADVAGLDEANLKIYRFDDPTWTVLTNCSVDTSLKTVTCDTSNFSDFAIFGVPAEATTSGARQGAHRRTLAFAPTVTPNIVSKTTYKFTRDLKYGVSGDDVKQLQTILMEKGFFVGPLSGWFGPITRTAVSKYQQAYSISPTAGYFGPITKKSFENN